MIYVKTELGKKEFQDKSLGFTLRQRSAFILFNGERTVEDIIKMTSALNVTTGDIDHMVAAGVLALSAGVLPDKPIAPSSKPAVAALTPSLPVAASIPNPPVVAEKAKIDEQVQYSKAYPIAVKLTSALGFRGFMLNLSVESAGNLKALRDLAPKIKNAVGADKFKGLEEALYL